MKVCHVCSFECEDSAELCPVCGAQLLDTEEGVFDLETEDSMIDETVLIEEPVLAVCVEDIITAEVYRDILKENGIPFTCDSAEEDGSMKVLFGGGFVTEDIYVDAQNLERAKQLYEETLAMLENEVEYDMGEFEETENSNIDSTENE